jgi:uncharacterized membrane protein YeiB
MALTAAPPVATTRRLPGPDVVRAVALIGVCVMNYHGYLLLEQGAGPGSVGDGWAAELFDPWTGPLSTRFAATFVLVAGVGVTLLTRGADPRSPRGTRGNITDMRWRLVRRGVLLYTGGLVLDRIWPGTIIPFYGAMFVVAAGIFTWRARWVIALGAAAALTGSALRMWRFERNQDGQSTAWLTNPGDGSVRDYVFGVLVNGTHPLVPWLAFLCAGIVLGRTLTTTWWRPAAAGAGLVLVTVAALLSSSAASPFQTVLLSTHPFDRGAVYVASALGTALLAYAAIDLLAERFPRATDPLRRAGQMSLTIYLAHILVFNLVVDWWGWIEPAGLDVALTFALGFWIVAIAAAVAWQRRYGRGPAERVYRAFGG